MLMMVMTGAGIAVLVSTRSDLTIGGVTREQRMALYAAEYAVARAKGLIASQTSTVFSPTTGWTPLLTSTTLAIQNILCDPTTVPAGVAVGAQPGTVPLGDPVTGVNRFTTLFTVADSTGTPIPALTVQWRYCVHNNADDPAYLNPSYWPPTGNVSDTYDSNQHFITIEAYATAPNNASAHLTVTVGVPSLSTASGGGSYAQEGGGSTHTGAGGASEAGITVSTGVTTF
jgi:Tfp pilus assembly protein PilX